MKAKVILLASKQSTILRGHPWVFPKAISSTSGKLVTGTLVEIASETGELVGLGVYNEHSLYRVRVLALASETCDQSSLPALIDHRLQQAALVRQCLQLPNECTTAYRLFNSEADGLSGLTIDRFNKVCVVASSAYWVELHKKDITEALQRLYPHDTILWLPQIKALAQDGWKQETDVANSGIHEMVVDPADKPRDVGAGYMSGDVGAGYMSGDVGAGYVSGDVGAGYVSGDVGAGSNEVLEAGIKYQVNFAQSQKTGLFIDQRENHQRIAALAAGKRVLDLYTYTGGFALHAAKAGALAVTAVDSSEHAIAQAKTNAALNGLSEINFIEADARDYLEKAGEYDIVVLDPPKLVPSRQHLERAKNYYRFLHREVFKHMRIGSLLMTCNCSSALSANEFCSLVSAQARAVGKQARIIGVYGPASCHPTLAAFPEGNYLTAVLVAVV
ncbi:MAG: class I SAM-dependent rRNA methyltransferase [Legionella sp.]|jgi:23S rRNA (cytosine1962-C5)-methyltransferase